MFKNEDEFKKIVDRLEIDDKPDPKHKKALFRQMLSVFTEAPINQQSKITRTLSWNKIRRMIMKSPISKLAAAAIIIIALVLGFNLFLNSTEGVAFADVIQPFLSARTATFTVTIEGEGMPVQQFDGMFMAPGKMRQASPSGGGVIIDLEAGKIVTLLDQINQAIVVEMTNIPEEPGSLNFFEDIRNRILQAEPFEDESVEFLGQQQLNGQNVIVYRVDKLNLHGTVWANPETKMPVQLEIYVEPMTVTMSDVVFDVELDESLFDQTIPEGYEVKTLKQDLSEPDEDDLIESFRIWTEYMDGKFPSKMESSAVNEFVMYQQEKLIAQGQEPSMDMITDMQQVIIDMTRGFLLTQSLPEDTWEYAGEDAEFGDETKAIFWYLHEGSETYRVIYADLHVEDVAPEDLPK
ncbi:MAG: LolA family protein [Planctomycetota bacterium]